MILFQWSLGSTRDVFFPLNLSLGSGEYIFHGLALVLGKLFIHILVGEYTSLVGRDCSGDVAIMDGYLLLVEAGYVCTQGFRSMLKDFVEIIRGFLQAPTARKLLYELVNEGRKGAN